MGRLSVALASVVFAASALLQAGSAQAFQGDVEWCYEDPIVVVFGAQFKIVTAAHTQASAVGGFAYTIEVPSNAAGRTTIAYPHGRGPATTVQVNYTGAAWSGTGSFSVSTSVTVTAPAGTDVVVSVSGPTVASATYPGKAGSPVSFSTSVTPGAASDSSGSNGQ